MLKSDHVALTLPVDEISAAGISECEKGSLPNLKPITARKSLRRTWNQLSRCQRNLIILIISAMCITLLFLLPTQNFNNIDKKIILTPDDHILLDSVNLNNDNAIRDNNRQLRKTNKIENYIIKGKILSVPNIVPAPAPQPQQTQKQEQYNIAEKGQEVHKPQQLDDLQNIENVINVPNSQEQQQQQQKQQQQVLINNNLLVESNEIKETLSVPDINQVSIYESNIEHSVIELALRDPKNLPGNNNNGIDIEEYLGRIQLLKNIPQKQHFHGARNARQEAVVKAFKHSWNGYKKYAWGHDNLKPISGKSYDWFGLGLTIIDSLDTMYIMGLEDEFAEARNWVSDDLNLDINRDVNLFEVTIRVLGGLLSAYHLSADTIFLKKSIELGNRLLPCFLSPSGIPYSDVNLAALSAHSPKWSPDSSTSEVTTIQLEFRDLSRTSNVTLYENLVQRVNHKVHKLNKTDGLVPIFINANTGTFRNFATISLGARGDSYYEYLLKQWIQMGHKENDYLITDYLRAIDGVFSKLLRRTPKTNHVYIGELINGKDFKPKMDHLTCYLPGTLLLGHHYGLPDSHLLLARDLLETCYQTYMRQPTKLAPEITYFAVHSKEELDFYVKPNDAHNLLRPEFVESLYYFYALTGNHTYQEMGWTIFQAFEKHTKVINGYTSIGNVKSILNIRYRDMMESFWLGETLKYFYLLFSDNPKEIDLEKWVFNTEAHPLPIWKY